MAILTQSTDPSFTAPLTLMFSGYGNFAQGDVVQVLASHSFVTSETIGAGSLFSMIQSGPTAPAVQVPPALTSSVKTFTADANMSTPPTAFFVQPDGGISPIDPTIIQGQVQAPITQITIVSNVLTVTCNNTFSMGATVYLNSLTTATFLNGQSSILLTVSSSQFTMSFTHANYGPTADTGTASSGGVLYPFIDGITTTPVTTGDTVGCATTYGGAYQIAGASFTSGALLYVGLNGVLTQNYETLLPEVQWIICAGRAINANTVIYEPSLPLQVSSLSY
jgi:hypothetical protein